jgi:hypothetical protein
MIQSIFYLSTSFRLNKKDFYSSVITFSIDDLTCQKKTYYYFFFHQLLFDFDPGLNRNATENQRNGNTMIKRTCNTKHFNTCATQFQLYGNTKSNRFATQQIILSVSTVQHNSNINSTQIWAV